MKNSPFTVESLSKISVGLESLEIVRELLVKEGRNPSNKNSYSVIAFVRLLK